MNAALEVHGEQCLHRQPHGGIVVVAVSDPANPTLVGGPFDAHEGESTRELRVWRSQNILIVLNTNCGVGDALHHCTSPSISNIRFYDISGANATQPELIRQVNVDTHEFFLWQDRLTATARSSTPATPAPRAARAEAPRAARSRYGTAPPSPPGIRP